MLLTKLSGGGTYLVKEKEIVRMRVHKDFKKIMKKLAIDNEMNLQTYTKKYAEEKRREKEIKKRQGFGFKL